MAPEPTVMKYLSRKTGLVIEASAKVSCALDLMEDRNIDALGVQSLGLFSGIFTQSDFVRRVLRRDLNPAHTAIYDVMTLNPKTVTPDCKISEAYFFMARFRVSHIPVISRKGIFQGIIAEEDLRSDIQDLIEKTAKDYKALMGYIYGESYGLCANI